MADINICEGLQIKIVDIRSLILLLSSPESAVCSAAADALARHAEISLKNRYHLLGQGIITHLIGLCNSQDKKIKKAGISCIAAVTEVVEITPDMRRKDLLETIVKILSSDDHVDILDEAAFCIANLSKEFSSKVEIKKIGAIPVLVKLLDIQDPDVKKNSAIAISSLLEDFGIRGEIRFANGLRPILDLLTNEHHEVQENGLKCFIKASENASNRVEFKKLNVTKRFLDFLAIENNSSLFALALTSFSPYLEDSETITSISNQNGIAVLAALMANDDNQVKRQAAITFAKALKLERNQVLAKESGVLNLLATQIASNDISIVISAAILIEGLSKNESNLLDLARLGVVDSLLRHIQNEEKDLRKESLGALANFCGHAKVRTKIRNSPEIIPLIIKILSSDDSASIANAAECVIYMSEDSTNRAEVVRAGGIQPLVNALDLPDISAQSSACLALSRLLQEVDAQIMFSKYPKVMNRMVDLIQSPEISVCRNATYALATAAQNDANAISACSVGAIDALIQLSKDNVRRSKKFATDALEKLINYHVPAKYWLLNHLTSSNIITDGFYDIGYAGSNLEHVNAFPTISKLSILPADTKREIILIDTACDSYLNSLVTYLSENISSYPPDGQVKLLGLAVSKLMGGAINPDNLSDFNYKFKISELKLKLGTNVIPIGQITQVLADKVGLKPCSLVRGEYGRAWNIVDVKSQVVNAPPKSARRAPSSRLKTKQDPAAAVVNSSSILSPAEQKLLYIGATEIDGKSYTYDDVAIVDLMFEPGRLIPSQSADAVKYQRHFK